MDSSGFQGEQVERILAVTMRQRDYLYRLIERMRVKRFPHDDPVYLAALATMEKASNLCVVLARYRKDDGNPDQNVMTRKPWGGE